jgi:NDP-sugar pyrophosphorylase family protein
LKPQRIRVDFAIQARPLGTADAVAAAESFAAGQPFLMLNSDNYYPIEALRALRELDGPGVAVFEQEAMIAGSNIPPERISKFAVVETGPDGRLKRIIEKPDEALGVRFQYSVKDVLDGRHGWPFDWDCTSRSFAGKGAFAHSAILVYYGMVSR